MQESFRLFTNTSPKTLNKKSIDTWGIQSHPEEYQSTRYKSWLALCNVNNSEKLKSEMLKFLQSKDSVKNIADLGKDWQKVITTFFETGNRITKDHSYQIIKENKPDTLFGKEKTMYAEKFMAVADTMLALTYLKNLSHKENIDYQAVIKVMNYVERSLDTKYNIIELNILKHFEKSILLPRCFFKHNPCDGVISTETKFAYLQEHQISEEKISGCKSNNCTCTENEDCVKQSKCCVKPRIDLIDLLVVKTATKCYRAGDISYIKNVLEGEVLSTKHRELNRTEELTETETDIKQFEEKYLQTEDKTSLNNETEDVLKTDKGMDAGLTTNSSIGASVGVFKFGGGTNSTTNLHSNQSKSETNKVVRDYSKDIIDRATKQIEQKVRNLSKVTTIHETEEKNKHVYDNSKGDNNINGQYLFVNKISRAQVYNYGICPVIDLILPEPAALYKRLFEKKFTGKKPNDPQIINIYGDGSGRGGLGIDEITPAYVETIKSKIKDLPKAPKEVEPIILKFQKNNNTEDYRKGGVWQSLGSGSDNGPQSFNIPNGYFTASMEANLNGSSVHHSLHNGTNCYLEIILGGARLHYGNDGMATVTSILLPQLEGNQSVSVFYNELEYYSVEVVIKCKLKPEAYKAWQTEIYSKIVEYNDQLTKQYDKELSEYDKAKEEFEAKVEREKKERYNKNSFTLRELEKEELKRMAISYISCQFFDQFDAMKNKVEPCGYPEMNVKEAYEEGKFIQFFEQSFQWNLMTYIFYPYFWGKKCSWGKSLKEEATDLIFEKFLQAGSCHIQIPLRPSHFDIVLHFINTGEIWNGASEPPIPTDPHYVSLAQEVKEQFRNFNSEREGLIDTMSPANVNKVLLHGNQDYWNTTSNLVNQNAIDADINREILIDFVTYRIVAINETVPASTIHDTWEITLDRDYEKAVASNLQWSTGSIYVGAPWEFVTPTNLVFLRNKSKCLPCYPLEECKE